MPSRSRSRSRGRRPQHPAAIHVPSSSSGDESDSSSEEEDESEGSGAEERDSTGKAEAEGPRLPSCPICMNDWTADGLHRVSCIPCGHVYGRSCLERWLLQFAKKKAPCPQCGRKYKQSSIINLYVPEIAIPNNDLEKQVLSLREKNESLEMQRQIILQQNVIYESNLKRQKMTAQASDGTTDAEPTASLTDDIDCSNLCSFVLQNEIVPDGARVMAIDASNQDIYTSGRAPGFDSEYFLTKISMFAGRGMQKIHLPPDTKAIRDICILPGGHAVFTSLGRKLSLFSLATNNVVLQYDLPAPGWSCSGDHTSSTRIYAGLQNGMLLVFDTRQTSAPLHSVMGLSMHPVHTIHSSVDASGSRKILSASAIGPCIWDVDGNENRPKLVSGTENQGVCISLACIPSSSDLLVASYRPKVEVPDDGVTQAVTPLSLTPAGSGKLGRHVLMRTGGTSCTEGQICNGSVSDLRMSKSAIIPCGNNHLFAYGDESLYGLRTWRLPSFQTFTDLSSHREPILDLKFAESSTGERYLGCLSGEKLQIFRVR